jgi:two-component system, NtrC family, response regulator PilR
MSKKHEPRVLIADDDQSIRQLLGTIITREHINVDLAADGLEAIERIKERDYSVILLDLMMPRMDGFGVVEYLKNHPPALKPVIIVISAYADQKFKAIDSDMVSGILRKPFEVAEIGGLVKLCISGIDAALNSTSADHDETVRTLPPEGFAKLEEMRANSEDNVN